MIDKIVNEEYTFIEVNGQNGIKIDSGEFEGVIVRIDSASIQDDESGQVDGAVLSFDYQVIYDAEKLPEVLQTVEFKNTIGDILLKIIENSLENTVESEQTYIEES